MIDLHYITNENIFSLDYCGEARRASLAKLQRELDQLDADERRKNNFLIAAFRSVLGSVRLNPLKTTFQSRKAEGGSKEDK